MTPSGECKEWAGHGLSCVIRDMSEKYMSPVAKA